MAKIVRRTYSDAEKASYVAEFKRLYRAGDRTYASIARELGVPESNYYAWAAGGSRSVHSAPSSKPAPPDQPRVPYTPEDRKRLVAEVERLRAAGQSIVAACRVVGIGEKSFRSWHAQDQAPLPLREVTVTAQSPAAPVASSTGPTESLAVVSPGGYRVEGLDVETAARLLRALAC